MFAVLRQLRSIRRSEFTLVVQSLVTSLVLSHLDYGNATLASIPQHLLWQLQSVINAAARLIYSSLRFDTSLRSSVNFTGFKAKERLDFKLTVLVFKCLYGSVPPYLTDELSRTAYSQARCRLYSTSSSILVIC